MDRVLEVNEDDLDCLVQAGLTRKALNHSLRTTGLWALHRPSLPPPVGGAHATAAGGGPGAYGLLGEGWGVVLKNGAIGRKAGLRRASVSVEGCRCPRHRDGGRGSPPERLDCAACAPPPLRRMPLHVPQTPTGQQYQDSAECQRPEHCEASESLSRPRQRLVPRDASEGKGPQRRPQQRLGRRLEEVAKAVGGRLLSVTNAVEAGTWR